LSFVSLSIYLNLTGKISLEFDFSSFAFIIWPIAFCISSGVARIPGALLGQEILLRPPLTKTTEFEAKNRCKSAEKAKTEHLL